MSLRGPGQLTRIRMRHQGAQPPPAVFVETGTFHGKTTRWAAEQFREVHTVELHPEWYAMATRELMPLGVRCYLGDSAEVVPRLAQEIAEPALWYLDAHWFTRVAGVAGQDVPLPLWAELEAIAARQFRDIIAVDDVASFGKSQPTPEWESVSLERIAGYFPAHREAVILGDQAVVYR